MAEQSNLNRSINPKNGFCSQTKTFYSLRPPVELPPPAEPLSVIDYTFSLLQSTANPLSTTPALIDNTTDRRLSYSEFIHQVQSLSFSLQTLTSLRKGDVAFILSPPSIHIPVIYFSLLSLGIIISPANPLGSNSEVAHQVQLTKPVIAFATSSTAHKLPKLQLGAILIDSAEFQSMITIPRHKINNHNRVKVDQSDSAAILFSSGTTGRVKGVLLTHRNLIALIAGFYHLRPEREENSPHPVSLFTLPLFHVFGFFMLVRAVSIGETLVLMERFDFVEMLKAVEKYRVLYMPVSPPLVVALAKSEEVSKYDLSSLQLLGCGGAPLGKEVSEKFAARFPNVEITQGYGLTETGGGAARHIGPDENKHFGSVGCLAENMEARIVDPATGESLPPGQQGELWLRGPTVMKGYVGDDEATAATLDSEGWLKTGDLCYFDFDGFLYIVDRLKELIKYKAYQVPPVELEHLLLSNPDIADAAVIPYPDEDAGQIPMAYIVRKPGSNITAAQVMDFIAKQVAPYKKLRRVAFINSIPKSPAGKILRRELVNHALSDDSSTQISLIDPSQTPSSQEQPNDTHIDKSLQRLETFLRIFGFCQYSPLSFTLSWLSFLLLGIVLRILVIELSYCSNCDKYEIKSFELEILIFEAIVSTISLICISHNLRKYRVRKFLFVDRYHGHMSQFRDQYLQKINGFFRLLVGCILPCLFVKILREVILIVYVHNDSWWQSVATLFAMLVSWTYTTIIFLSACVLYNLVCSLHVIHFENYGKFLERDLDVSVYIEEHMRLRHDLSKISHRFRIYLVLEFFTVTVSEIVALFLTTGNHDIINFINCGDFVVSSIVQLVGIVICLQAAAKISHRAQGLAAVASRWHALVTSNTSDASQSGILNSSGNLESANPAIPLSISYSESDLESVDYVPVPTNTQLASYMSSYHKRQAFVTYTQCNPSGATIYGWTVDRTLINTIFFVEMGLVLFVLGKTITFSTK